MKAPQVRAESDRVLVGLEDWSYRIRDRNSVRIARGSDLKQPPVIPGRNHRTSVLAWRALATAGEMAGHAFTTVTLTSGGVHTKPFLALSRTALVSAARALYLLEPDSADERKFHTLQLYVKEFKDIKSVIDEWEKGGGTVTPRLARQRTKALDGLGHCGKALEALRKPAGSHQTDTGILTEASKHLAGGTVHEPRTNVFTMWHLSSGVAHGRSWPWDDLGLEHHDIHTQVAVMWSNPLGLMNAAWDLWNRRRAIDHTYLDRHTHRHRRHPSPSTFYRLPLGRR